MSKLKTNFNPFYLLAMIVGIGFTITACAYGLMMVRAIHSEGLPQRGEAGFDLMDLLNKRGTLILCVELGALAVASVAAIYLDHAARQARVGPAGEPRPAPAQHEAESPARKINGNRSECSRVQTLLQIGLVAIGSACGGVLRWAVGSGVGRVLGNAWPLGTFLVNITGSVFLGWFLTRLELRSEATSGLSSEHLRLLIAVGFTGGYTTFSAFEWESLGLLRADRGLAALAYILGSVAIGLVGIYLGAALARNANP